jgi:hypothetical protein
MCRDSRATGNPFSVGEDPVAITRRAAHRIRHVHLKDYVAQFTDQGYQRTREFGVRVAFGATPGRVMALVIREGLMLTVPGVIAGIAGALLVLRLASRLLVGVGAADPSTHILTALLQIAVALGACALPAMTAMRADPRRALREE